MKDYFRETEFVLDKLQFDYLGGCYQGRGIMTWKPEQGFHIEAPLDLQDMPQPEDVEFGKVRVTRKSDRSSIHMVLHNSNGRAIAPSVILVDRWDIIHENRISVDLERVVFLEDYSRYSSRNSTNKFLTGSALYEVYNINFLFDPMNRETKLKFRNHGIWEESIESQSGFHYTGEKGQLTRGHLVDKKYLKISWWLPREHFTKAYSWRLPEAIQYSLSILFGQSLRLLKREVNCGRLQRIEIRQKQPIFSLDPIFLFKPPTSNEENEKHKEYFVKLTDLIVSNKPEGAICCKIFEQLLEASRQRNWQVRELLVATTLEAALRNNYKVPFKPSESWNVSNNLGKFVKESLAKEWDGISKRVIEDCKYLRNRNAHPDWLFTQGGALSEEEQAKALDSMIFLSRFYGYMILALAGFRNLKPDFPKPHSEWSPVLIIAPTHLNGGTQALSTPQTQQLNNPWQSLLDSLDRFSEDFMETREQPQLQVRENLFE